MNLEAFQAAHINQCMARFGHLLPIIAVLACTTVSGVILIQQQIVWELNLVPEFHPFTTTSPIETNATTTTVTAAETGISTSAYISTTAATSAAPVLTSTMTTTVAAAPTSTEATPSTTRQADHIITDAPVTSSTTAATTEVKL